MQVGSSLSLVIMASNEMEKSSKEKEPTTPPPPPPSSQVLFYFYSHDFQLVVILYCIIDNVMCLQEPSSAVSAGMATPDWSGFQV